MKTTRIVLFAALIALSACQSALTPAEQAQATSAILSQHNANLMQLNAIQQQQSAGWGQRWAAPMTRRPVTTDCMDLGGGYVTCTSR